MLRQLMERWESRRRERAAARRKRARWAKPRLEQYEERVVPYAAPTV